MVKRLSGLSQASWQSCRTIVILKCHLVAGLSSRLSDWPVVFSSLCKERRCCPCDWLLAIHCPRDSHHGQTKEGHSNEESQVCLVAGIIGFLGLQLHAHA